MEHFDILIVGAGAAGIAAAKECRGLKVLLADRRATPGGVLPQCAHRGFGSGMNGPEYTATLLRDLPKDITLALNTTVLAVTGKYVALVLKVQQRPVITVAAQDDITPLAAVTTVGTTVGKVFCSV